MVRVRTLKKEIEQLHSMTEDNQFVIGLLAEAVESLYDVRDPIADTFLMFDAVLATIQSHPIRASDGMVYVSMVLRIGWSPSG